MSQTERPTWSLRYRPRDWQTEALRFWEDELRGIVRVVTGGGKTVFAELCILRFRERHPRGMVIVLVPTITLLDQWFVALQDELGVPKEEIACFSSQEKASKPRTINLMVLNTGRKLAPKLARDREVMLIVDECHRAGSPANALAIQISPVAALGLSATPERQSDQGFQDHIAPALGSIIFRYDYNQAYRDGVISPFELVNVRVELLPDEEKRYTQLSRRAALESRRLEQQGGSDERLKRILLARAAIASTAAMRIPVAAKLVEQNRGRRTIVFHERISAANHLVGILNEREHCATVYHSRIGASLRRDNLRLYRQGVFDVLVTCRALDEGMNAPETTVAIIASSTSSERQRIQRLGRVLRPAPGKSHATIFTIYATDVEDRRLKEEEKKLEGVAGVKWSRGVRKKDG